MPNYHDQESNQSQRREGRPGKSSGWRSVRADRVDRSDGYQRRDSYRDDYKRTASSERSEGGKRYWDSERSRGGRDYRRDGDRQRDGYKREDRRGGYQRHDDRRDGDRARSWDRSERGYGSRDERGNSLGSYRRDGDRQRDWNRGDRDRGTKHSWDRSDRGYGSRDEYRDGYKREGQRGGYQRHDDRRDGYGRSERGDGYKRRDDRGRDGDRQRDWNRGDRDRGTKRSWNRDDRRSAGRGFGRGCDNRNDRSRRDAGFDDGYRNVRGGEEKRARAKELQREIPDSITPDMLPEQTYNHLRGLNKDNAQMVARHLAYAAEMMDIDPEVSYQHSKAAYARAARIDIVREALGIAAYVTGRYAEALTELRAYRRFSNDYSHVAMEADSERGLGRSEKALRFIADIPLDRLDPAAKVELAIVTSGAKADMGDSEGGLRLMEKIIVKNLSNELAARVELVKADRLDELGRTEEAQDIRAHWEPVYGGDDKDSDILLDLADVYGDAAYGDADMGDESSEGDESASAETAETDDFIEDDEFAPGGSDELVNEENLDNDINPDISLEDELKEELGDDFLAEEWTEEFSDAPSDAPHDEHDDAARVEEA